MSVPFVNVEMNLVCCTFLLIMLFSLSKKGHAHIQPDQTIFEYMAVCTVLLLLFDSGMWLIDGQSFNGAMVINYLVTIFYYLLQPIVCMLWLIYVDYKLNESRDRIRKLLPYSLIPVLLNAILSIASPMTGWAFYVDVNNIYHRGQLNYVAAVLCFLYLFVSVGYVIRNRIKEGRGNEPGLHKYLILFPTLPTAGALIQFSLYGISLLWISVAVAAFIIFVNIQNSQIFKDSLTGVYNRRQLEKYIAGKIKNMRVENDVLYLIMLDIDSFKAINDTYGHLEGDKALQDTADILSAACDHNHSMLARYGGDEFVISGVVKDLDALQRQLQNIEFHLERHNKRTSAPYKLAFSKGYSVFCRNSQDELASFVARADKRMYANKLARNVHRNTFN